MGLIKDIVTKLACSHEWVEGQTFKKYDSETDVYPAKVVQVLYCKKCGKVKKYKI